MDNKQIVDYSGETLFNKNYPRAPNYNTVDIDDVNIVCYVQDPVINL